MGWSVKHPPVHDSRHARHFKDVGAAFNFDRWNFSKFRERSRDDGGPVPMADGVHRR